LLVLAECNVENVCRSHRASNGLGKEQRANLSMLRLGHQTGRNQLLRREEEKEKEGGLEVVAAVGRLSSFDVHALLLLP